jgi:sialate O-acetylesterase
MKSLASLLLALFFLATTLTAQVKFAALFTDHAVLQRQKPIPVWGWAEPNKEVTVSLGQQTLKAQADGTGKWQVQFAALEAGGPYKLTVIGPSNHLTLNDILIGDVWLCSGQSNMEWPVASADNYQKERQNADFPQIRHFLVAHEVALQPQTDLHSGKWEVSNAQTVGGFTAIGFFFAREIYQKTGVPIGLLHSSWGGSQVEGWISKEAMLSSEELKANAQQLPTTWEAADLQLEKNIKKKLFGSPDVNITLADEKKYLQADFDFSKWWSADPFGQWDWKGIWAWRGNGYMARMVDIPAEMTDQVTTLSLGELYSHNEIYINGKLVASGLVKGVRKILVPANTWQTGANKLMVKMNRAIEPEWYGLGINGPATDLYVGTEKQKIPLAGNTWKIMPAFAEPHAFAHSSNNVGASIYNAMIAPLVPYGIRGALWYQGESNAGRAYQYRKTFPLMIEDWRQRWNDVFPFYFVQLSSYGAYQNSNEGSDWAELREAQTMTLRLPQTGMAVTTDVGNPNDIHPTNKQDVGKRLAATALNNVYGKKEVVPCGPLYEAVKFKKDQAILSFNYVGSGLMAKDKFGYLKGFEIAGEDHVFHYAKAQIVGNTVVLMHPEGKPAVTVRYGWANSPLDANLFNKEGFPASPFRTDQWDGLTVKNRFE